MGAPIGPPAGLSPSGQAAWTAGATAAHSAVAQVAIPTTTTLTLDRGGGLDGRITFAWCLTHQAPLDRCPCTTEES